jgi:hypothetical protein
MTDETPTTNPPRAENVLTLKTAQKTNKQVEKEAEEKSWEEISAFNELCADYLVARAKTMRPGQSDDELDKAVDKLGELTWRIIHTPTPMSHQIDFKFEIMREIMEVRFADGRARAMLESIRNDVMEED